jgi:hypothetical protein
MFSFATITNLPTHRDIPSTQGLSWASPFLSNGKMLSAMKISAVK